MDNGPFGPIKHFPQLSMELYTHPSQNWRTLAPGLSRRGDRGGERTSACRWNAGSKLFRDHAEEIRMRSSLSWNPLQCCSV